MSRNRVGSLYYEIALNAGAFARDTAKIKKESGALAAALRKHQAMMSPEQRLREDRKAQVEAVKRSKMTYDKKRELIRSLFAYERQELRRIQQRRVDAAQANLRTAERTQERLRKTAFGGGLFGTGPAMQGIGRFTQAMQTLALQILPVVAGLYALARAFRMLTGAIMAAVAAADKKKSQLLGMASLMGGNIEEARALRLELKKYAQDTSFSVEETMEMAKAMKAFGFATDELVPRISQFGKLAFGDPVMMKRIAKAYTDVAGAGKLLSRDLKQFTEAGVPLRQMLMQLSGKTFAQFNSAMENGEISIEMVNEAMDALGQTMGDSDKLGLMTFQGQWESLKEQFETTLEILGESGLQSVLVAFFSLLNSGLELINKYLLILKNLRPIMAGVIADIAQLIKYAAGGALATGQVMLAKTLYDVAKAANATSIAMKEMAKAEADALEKQKQGAEDLKRKSAMDTMLAKAEAQKKAQEEINDLMARQEAKNQSAAGNDRLQKVFDMKDAIAEAKEKVDGIFANLDMTDVANQQKKAVAIAKIEAKVRAEFKAKQDAEDLKEAKKKFDEERKEKQKKLKEALDWYNKAVKKEEEATKKRVDKFNDAAGGSGPQTGGISFGAGSTQEFEFLRQMELQKRKDENELKLNQDRNKTLEAIHQVLDDTYKKVNTGTVDPVTGTTVFEAV